jgi:SUMO ligase MMS21 Smc5/6 complex component
VADAAIQQQEACPITLTPFTQTTIAMLTTCGHLFDKEALMKSLAVKNQCPICRQSGSSKDIQVY